MISATLRVLGEHEREINRILAKYPNKRSATLPLLFLVQSVEGYVTEDGMRDVGDILGITAAEVLGVASFYTMLKQQPTGDYLISVCRNITCTHLGGRRVLRAFENELGVAAGDTTDDGRFTLEAAECLATCDGAPSLQVNYEDILRVTPDDVTAIVERLRAGEALRSSANEVVKTHREASLEIALTGAYGSDEPASADTARTVSGEVPASDMAPGFRPPVGGHGAKNGGS